MGSGSAHISSSLVMLGGGVRAASTRDRMYSPVTGLIGVGDLAVGVSGVVVGVGIGCW